MGDGGAFDCFLSHNSKDKAAVLALAAALRAAGVSYWLDNDQCIPGDLPQSQMDVGIRNSRSMAVMIGGAGIGPWEKAELQAGIALAVKDQRRVIPVILPSAPNALELPVFLDIRTRVDLRPGAYGTADEGLALLIFGIRGERPDPVTVARAYRAYEAYVSGIVESPSGSADSVLPAELQRQPANLPQHATEEIDKSLGFSPALCSVLAQELGGDKDSTPATIARRLCSPTADFLTVLDALDKGLRALARPPKPPPHEIEQIQKNALTVLGWVAVATVAAGYEQEDAQLARRWREGTVFRVPLGRGPCVEVITARWRDGKAEFGIDTGSTDYGHDDLVPAVIQEIGFDTPEHLTPHRAVDAVWGRVHQEMLRRQANEPVRGARRQDAAKWLAGQVRKYKRRLRLVLDVHHPLAAPEVLRAIHEQLPDLLLILVDDEAAEDPSVFILHPAELSAAIYDCLDAIRSLP